MDVATLKTQIQQKKLQQFYIFTGTEWEVQKLYIEQIANASNFGVVRVDSILDFWGKLSNRSFVQSNYCYVVRDDKELMTNDKVWDKIDTGILGKNILILLCDAVDKRTKFHARYQKQMIEFKPLSDAVLKKYVKKLVDLSDRNCQLLIDICEHDYGRILLEIDKIKRYTDVYKGDDNHSLEVLIADGTIYEPPYDAVFDVVDAILDRKIGLTYNLYTQCKDYGESNLTLLSVLYTNAKAVLQVQACQSDNIEKTTGLAGWQIRNAKKHLKKYSIHELVSMLKLIQQVEQSIKFGEMPEELAIEYILVEVL